MSRPDPRPDETLEKTAAELEGRLAKLEDHLSDAERQAAEHRREAVGATDIAGDWHDTKPEPAGGDDPKGALS